MKALAGKREACNSGTSGQLHTWHEVHYYSHTQHGSSKSVNEAVAMPLHQEHASL